MKPFELAELIKPMAQVCHDCGMRPVTTPPIAGDGPPLLKPGELPADKGTTRWRCDECLVAGDLPPF